MYRAHQAVWLWFRNHSTLQQIAGSLGSIRLHSAAFGFCLWRSIKIGSHRFRSTIHLPTDVFVINIRF